MSSPAGRHARGRQPGAPTGESKATEAPSVIQARGLRKEYGDRPALEALDVTIAPGETVALIGHNGSGKSTFLRLTAGLIEASAGSVRVAGAEAGSMPARAALSYVGDQPSFYDDLSVRDHLEYVARLHGVADWEEIADALVEHLGIAHRMDDLPSTFSRGLRQKAAIALGFVRPFDVIVVDEPFVGLDLAGRDALVELLDQARTDGAAVVVATHEVAFAAGAPRTLVLADGVLVYDGSDGESAAREHLGER